MGGNSSLEKNIDRELKQSVCVQVYICLFVCVCVCVRALHAYDDHSVFPCIFLSCEEGSDLNSSRLPLSPGLCINQYHSFV